LTAPEAVYLILEGDHSTNSDDRYWKTVPSIYIRVWQKYFLKSLHLWL